MTRIIGFRRFLPVTFAFLTPAFFIPAFVLPFFCGWPISRKS